MLEVFTSGVLMVLTSLSLVHAFGSSSQNSRDADRALAVQQSLESVAEASPAPRTAPRQRALPGE